MTVTGDRRIILSRDWRWRFLISVEDEAVRVCLFGVLVEVVRR